jgi:hypothetical protein
MKQRTMTDLDKIKDKIKKLFALSKSPNANEAAVALEMAQKLMAEYGVKYTGSGEFEIAETEVKANGGKKPPRYEIYLMGVIAEAFGCRCAYGRCFLLNMKYSYHHTFIGLEHRVKIATFIADVLLRKLKNARSAYIKTLPRHFPTALFLRYPRGQQTRPSYLQVIHKIITKPRFARICFL